MKSIPQQVSKSGLKPEGVPDNWVFYRGAWCHPSRAPCCTIPVPVERGPSFIVGPPPKRIRQSTKPLMNKLEGEWEMVLHERYGQFGFPVFPQSVRFKLGNGIWYKPDFVAFSGVGIMAFEVKGPFAHRGGLENLKVAAHLYHKNILWTLVWKQDGKWQEQIVLP